jgi:hypothetical protein
MAAVVDIDAKNSWIAFLVVTAPCHWSDRNRPNVDPPSSKALQRCGSFETGASGVAISVLVAGSQFEPRVW